MIYILEHMNDFWPGLVLCLITGLLMTNCPWGRRVIEPFANTRLDRTVIGLLLGGIIMVGWTKGPVSIGSTAAQFVTALRSGGIIDESGLVAASTEAETVEAFAELSSEIINAASQTVVDAQSDIDDVAMLITNTPRKVVYLQCALPRTDPLQGITNHNISAIVMRTRQSDDGVTLSRYVWYSEQPEVAPGVVAEVDVGGGAVRLTAVTNSFQETESIQGIPCVRYDYTLPESLRKVVFFPDTELEFGSDNTPLLVPAGGIVVDDGSQHTGWSGTDLYFGGRVQVIYTGGIATALYIDGNSITNGVYTL